MPLLVVRQAAGGNPGRLHLIREDGKGLPAPVIVPAAQGFPVEGRPQSDLMAELRWYLENFLEYPFPPETERAERVLRALRSWGEAAFRALFGEELAGGHEKLRLQIRSNDPRVLSWPWEALHDPGVGPLGQICQIERRLDAVADPPPLSPDLPRDRVNILLVAPRPYEQDVAYRTIARPLIELIARHQIPAYVHVLRPPTFERLLEHLRERPGFYHILHFDGHGGYLLVPESTTPAPAAAYTYAGRMGKIAFEAKGGGPNYVAADQLAPVLREVAVPVVVLNACRSAMLDAEAESAFASIAAALLQSGTRSVVAMGYNLYISAAEVLFPPFYRRLFESGSVPEAVRAGRQAMETHCERLSMRGRFPLSDWLLPVLYQHEDFDLPFSADSRREQTPTPDPLPIFGLEDEAPLPSLVGRDGALLALERALRRKPAGILVHGLGGVGKTTLARGLLEWLRDTDGLSGGAFWFSFQGLRSAEYVWNRLGERLFGPTFSAAVSREEKVTRLAEALRVRPMLIVWDNFEVVAGLPGVEAAPALPETDRAELKAFLTALHRGTSKVIITSRSEESWLGDARLRVPLDGLQGEERWEYCEKIVEELGLKVNREDSDIGELMDLLDGHPLAMRVILRELEKHPARTLIEGLKTDLENLGLTESGETAKLFTTLRLPFENLPDDLRPLLIPLALHERLVNEDLLEAIADFIDSHLSRAQIDDLLTLLTSAGLLSDLGKATYKMHPALNGFLRSHELSKIPLENRETWIRGFVEVMGGFADYIAPLPLHEQRTFFYSHRGNLHSALAEAERLGMLEAQDKILQALALYTQNLRDLTEATHLFERLVELSRKRKDIEAEAASYHQLGTIAGWQRDFATAEQWYRESLKLKEGTENVKGVAITYHQLGRAAEEQRDFRAAERWYKKALQIKEEVGDETGVAITCHQLGRIAQTHHHLTEARQWYRRSLEISEKNGLQRYAAATYHNLGMIAHEQKDLESAKKYYEYSLKISERLGLEQQIGHASDQLARLALARGDLAKADRLHRRALYLFEKLGDLQNLALTYGELGTIAALQDIFEEAGHWTLLAIKTFLRCNDPYQAGQQIRAFRKHYRRAPPSIRPKLRELWSDAGLGPFRGLTNMILRGAIASLLRRRRPSSKQIS